MYTQRIGPNRTRMLEGTIRLAQALLVRLTRGVLQVYTCASG
jgi:hypothetical protein